MTKSDSFKGFTPNTIHFLENLSKNNNKEWFESHRHIYEQELLTPFKLLVSALSPTMYNIDSRFELRPHRVLSRIYRDIRFSANKTPYKDHMWMTFQQPVTQWENYPGFFMVLNSDSYSYGMGLYMAKRKVMDEFRDKLEYDSAEFEKNTQINVLDRGFEICGEDYKRRIENNLPDYFQTWYQKKSVYVWKKCSIDNEVFSSGLADKLRSDFEALQWLYNFMKED